MSLEFRSGRRPRADWAAPVSSGRFAFLEMEDRRLLRDRPPRRLDPNVGIVRSCEQMEGARRVVSEFVAPERIDMAAMCLCMLRNAHPGRTIKRSMVLERLELVYPNNEEAK